MNWCSSNALSHMLLRHLRSCLLWFFSKHYTFFLHKLFILYLVDLNIENLLRWHMIPTLSLWRHMCTVVLLHSERLASSPLQCRRSRNIGPLRTPEYSVTSVTSTNSGMMHVYMRIKNEQFMAVSLAYYNIVTEELALLTIIYIYIL